MNERDASPIGFFQKYLTVWVILCMAVGISVGKFLPQIPEFLNRFAYARVLPAYEKPRKWLKANGRGLIRRLP